SVRRLYLDTNVFIAMAEGEDRLSSILYEMVGTQEPDEPFLYTSELSLAELIALPYRHSNDALIQLYDDWITDGGWLSVGPVARSVLWHAALIRSQYASIKLPDAIHLSTAIGFECAHFLTGDQRLPKNIELFHERWGIRNGPIQLEVLTLTNET